VEDRARISKNLASVAAHRDLSCLLEGGLEGLEGDLEGLGGGLEEGEDPKELLVQVA
jgi:hypothetical protein